MQLSTHEIVGNAPGPHLLITGGVHGDEFEPMAAIRLLMTAINPVELSGRVTLVPIVNEPAFKLGQRTAEDGLDLARTCPGRADGSVTEQIAFALSTLIRTANLYIDLHTGGTRLMVAPLSGYVLHRDEHVLNQQRRMARAFGLPIIWGTDPTLSGRSLSVARDANIPAIYTEYLGGARLDPAGTAAYVAGCLGVMREFGLLPRLTSPAVGGEPLMIEDDRPGSGHMQINHPAPCEGFFEAHVELGQTVQEGDVLGTVTDPLGQHVAVIRARYTGVVIVLHTFPRIATETSVAVILDITSFLARKLT
ncbi:Succinylglutamate desuccinylase / Aspartoacylase family protein [Anatilimnocola aggregata]|uniref:Succinylglutamate desuccinylase / Aspartoacylase family protein n=1 Tax=Anatilimnocola aggregata TaxID=2528021 RepID=A0A517YNE4_9BACT|nr:succinylglutamate desuccinylase/aspartoacylase family protein [Anatilimnocola aggregata]QDU31729.1 Succinylglutamate desuccinylase / Aspartoacylase family protein [Anatilimnocola aggregata]